MIVTKAQHEELDKLALPLQRWLESNCHPHCEINLESHRVELTEGICASPREDSPNLRSPQASTSNSAFDVQTARELAKDAVRKNVTEMVRELGINIAYTDFDSVICKICNHLGY